MQWIELFRTAFTGILDGARIIKYKYFTFNLYNFNENITNLKYFKA